MSGTPSPHRAQIIMLLSSGRVMSASGVAAAFGNGGMQEQRRARAALTGLTRRGLLTKSVAASGLIVFQISDAGRALVGSVRSFQSLRERLARRDHVKTPPPRRPPRPCNARPNGPPSAIIYPMSLDQLLPREDGYAGGLEARIVA